MSESLTDAGPPRAADVGGVGGGNGAEDPSTAANASPLAPGEFDSTDSDDEIDPMTGLRRHRGAAMVVPVVETPAASPPVTAPAPAAPVAPPLPVPQITEFPTPLAPPTQMVPPVAAADPRQLPNNGRYRRRKARAVRVRRTIRHIDPWSVFKVSIILYLCLYVAVMIAGVLLWNAAVGAGLIANIEDFIADIANYEFWKLNGEEIFRGAAVIGLVLAVAGAALNVLLTILFNLISDLTGGMRVTVIEEDTARPIR